MSLAETLEHWERVGACGRGAVRETLVVLDAKHGHLCRLAAQGPLPELFRARHAELERLMAAVRPELERYLREG